MIRVFIILICVFMLAGCGYYSVATCPSYGFYKSEPKEGSGKFKNYKRATKGGYSTRSYISTQQRMKKQKVRHTLRGY